MQKYISIQLLNLKDTNIEIIDLKIIGNVKEIHIKKQVEGFIALSAASECISKASTKEKPITRLCRTATGFVHVIKGK